VDFVEICKVYIGKTIIKAAKRIFNSDKICRSYSDLNFGVTFFGTQCIMERHESPPAMVETWPEEPGQSAFPLMDLDVELTSENVRTSDAPVSSRLRSTRCCSIVSGTNPLDQMTMQAADRGACRLNSPPPWLHQAFPRGPSLNGCKECLKQSPTRSPSRSQVSRHDEWEWWWLYRPDDRQTSTTNDETTVLTRHALSVSFS